ncbi:MAG: TIGR01212 family radical SAM protein [Deltaproteobacteria bacterium]|nr:TIGR01212 family radical SAM protein [Deltaproteobacteria bacterium]
MSWLPYRSLSSFLREKFGCRVQKISLDAGMSCPNRDTGRKGGCIYCNPRGSGTGAYAQGIGLKEQIERQMTFMARRYKAKAFIAYFQSYSNTYADVETLKSIYDKILPYPEIIGLAIGTRPDCIDREKLELISSYGPERLVWVEYGLQSADDETLKRINRGHDVKTFIDAVNLTGQYPIRTCAHIIIGLPGEGMEQYINTSRLIANLPVTDVKLHLLYIIKGTPIEDMYIKGLYRPLGMDEYAQAAAYVLAHLREDMVIQRITGDPHADELAAPAWAMEKALVRTAIIEKMEHLHLHQGMMYSKL